MKKIKCIAPVLLVVCLIAVSAAAQYSIDWWKIAGGGGTATGGYTLRATIGQHDVGTMTSSDFTLTGGFWAIDLVQVTNLPVPTLTVLPSGPGKATVSWTPDAPGFHLQTTDSLSPAEWVNAPTGGNHPITISTTGSMKFYRLVSP